MVQWFQTGTKDVGPVPPTEEPQVTQAWVFVCFFASLCCGWDTGTEVEESQILGEVQNNYLIG